MRVLLPPSESKRPGGGAVYAPQELLHDPILGQARDEVKRALVELSNDDERAARALKVGVRARADLARNRELDTAGALPAVERYTGVLYDALAYEQLDARARAWIARHVVIQSALFGVLRADDRIPAYRLSASSSLPGITGSLRHLWQTAHGAVDWSSDALILDLRSREYAALAPLEGHPGAYRLDVVQEDADGTVRALNHFNKAAKGDLVRRLAVERPEVSDAVAFARWAATVGLDVRVDPHARTVTLITTLGATGRS